jgi:O-antigen/teichoic acid export membrane protein
VAAAPPVGLGKRSVFWAALETGGTSVLTILAMLLMARMVGPEEFGTAALVIGSVQFLNLFVEGLFHDGLIQNPDTDDAKFETALSLVLIIAACIVAIGVAVGVALRDTEWGGAAWLVVGASLSLPFSGALGVANARMRRDLVFREVAHASLAGRLIGSVLGLVLAYIGLGAWSLVWQFTAVAVVQSIMMYRVSGWHPRLRGEFAALWPICRFAVPYAVMHSLVALRIQGFLMMVAAYMGLTAAGLVNVAFRLTTTPQIILATAFTNLGLPLLARHQRAAPQLEEAFRVLTQIVMSITIPAFVGLALTANDLVPILMGDRWTAVIPLVQVLAVGAAVSFLRFPASTLLRALGHVRYSFASAAFQLGFTLLGMLVLAPQDMRVAVWLWVLPVALQLPLCCLAVCRVSAIGLRTLIASLLPALVATAAMAVVVTTVAQALQGEAAWYRLVAEVACGAATAIVILLIADGRSRAYIAGVLRKAQV